MPYTHTTQSAVGWFLQRITGLLLAFFLFTHINVQHFAIGDRIIDFSLVHTRLASHSLWWTIYYLLFLPSCIFHALNGLWAIFQDYRPRRAFSLSLLWGFWIIGIVATVVGTKTLVVMFRG